MSSIDLGKLDDIDETYMETRKWKAEVMKEVSTTYAKIPDRGEPQPENEVVVEHILDFDAQMRIQARKRHLEDCGVVFCKVDLSPSRDNFLQRVYKEVDNTAAVQAVHVKVLAPRHYPVLMGSNEDRDTVLAGGPYYMRRRMVYTVPWEPGFDMKKILSKQLACWLDLLERGHFEHICPKVKKNDANAQEKDNQGPDDGFQFVGGCPMVQVQMQTKDPLPPQPTLNPDPAGAPNLYAVLEVEDDKELPTIQTPTEAANNQTGDPRPTAADNTRGASAPSDLIDTHKSAEEEVKVLDPNLLDLNALPANQGAGASPNVQEWMSKKDKMKARKKEARKKKVENLLTGKGSSAATTDLEQIREEVSSSDEEGPHRIKCWEQSKGQNLKALALQELKAGEIQKLEEDDRSHGLKRLEGRRVDQTRSDRAYLSIGGGWVANINFIEQDGQEAVSDHIPVTISCQWAQVGSKKKNKRISYLKLDPESLKCRVRRPIARRAWKEGWRMSLDPILAWDLAWGKMMEVFKEFRRHDREKISRLKRKQEELELMRLKITQEGGTEEAEWYSKLEKEVHALEMLE
ncbi:hypothetical protein R1sor_025708 [Riccia sorocarpa]|uniref:Uncharacterized protein n=1 Tax=Riccia sorocarpa TaxID=122646 RepID=A0ABD3GCL1_9MARC